MKKSFLIGLFVMSLLISCNKEKEIIDTLIQYNTEMETKGYHFGDKINFPKEVTENAESITISFGDKETANLVIDPKYFTLGDNLVTINITRDGKVINQDATINVFAKNPEKNLNYEIVAEYPHDTNNFVQGFQLEGNTIYESDGQLGQSRLIKYTLGGTNVLSEAKQGDSVFSEGSAIVDNKIYQLTWRNKKGFVYDKNSFKLLKEFDYPNVMGEGWGLTYDGKNLIASDGTKNLYFLDVNDPSKMVKFISVAGNKEVYDQLNELEYYNGYIYANVWQKPIILKIDPKTGEVIGKFDFSKLTKQNTKGEDDVLNGIAFKGNNMLVTGKNWSKIYEVKIE
jgi:glutamine cyclotransferase